MVIALNHFREGLREFRIMGFIASLVLEFIRRSGDFSRNQAGGGENQIDRIALNKSRARQFFTSGISAEPHIKTG